MRGVEGERTGPVERTPRADALINWETMDVLEVAGPTPVRVFLLLRRHRNRDTRTAMCSVSRMCSRLAISKPTALRALEELEELGLISRSINRGSATAYRFPIEDAGNARDTTSRKAGNADDTSTGKAGETDRSHPREGTGNAGDLLYGRLNGSSNGGEKTPPPSSDLLGDLLRIAKEAHVQGTERQLRERLAGWLAGRGEAEVRRVLSLPEVVGVDVLEIQDTFFSIDRKTEAKKTIQPDPNCPRCAGCGRRPNPVTGKTYACSCTEAPFNPRAVRA
jgi:DNA-binding MarR family transcriptional regulator